MSHVKELTNAQQKEVRRYTGLHLVIDEYQCFPLYSYPKVEGRWICEVADEDCSGELVYGTDDEREPKLCAHHENQQGALVEGSECPASDCDYAREGL